MSDINTARSSFDHAGFEKFMNASSDSLSDPSSPRKKPGRRVRAAGGGSKKRAAGGKRAKAEEKPWWDQGGGGGGGGGFDVNSSGGSSEVAQLGTGKNFLRQTRDPPQGRAPRLDDTLQQSGVASIGRVEDSDDFALEAEEDPQQRLGRAPAATDDDELRLQLTRSSLGDSETPAAPPMRGYAGNSRDADDLTTMDTESAAAADPSAGGLAGFKGKPSMLSKVSLLESLDSSSQQLQQPSAAQQPQEQHHGDTLHSQTDISAVRDAYKRRLDTLEESTDQRHSKATTGFFASGLNSLPSDQIPEPGQQQQQSGNVGGAMTATAPSATQSFGMQVIRPANKTEQKEMSIDDLLAEHDEVLTARPDSQRHPQLTPSPPPSPQQQQQQPQSAQRRHRQAAFDETKIVANPKVVRPPRAPAAAASAGDAPKRPQKQQQKPAAGKTKQPAGPPPQGLKFGHVKSSGYGRGGQAQHQRPQSMPAQASQQQQQQQQQPQKQRQSQQVQQQQQQYLREELDEWRDLLRAEKAHRVKLESDLRLMELERAKEAEAARRKHEQEVQQLRQEICTLEARLEVEPQQQQQQQQSVWRLVKQRPLGPDVTREEVDQLTNQMREQEELLAGYQKENERLYAELKSAKASGKGLADALSGQKLQLEQELREAREQLERQEVQLRSRLPQQPGPSAGPVSNAGPLLQQQERCAQLEAELRACRRRLDEALAESSSCQRDRLELQQQLDRLTRERLAAADQLTAAKSVRGVELEKMREQYETEIDRLQRKMTWFVENQRLVDKDQTKLREQNAAIAELRDRLEASEKQRLELLNRRRKRQGGKAVDGGDFENDDGGGSAARIKDLERQVRELESILTATRRRGDAVADSLAGTVGPTSSNATREHLERRCRELEARLSERESAEARSLRALRQRYEAAKEDYESRIQVLESDLKRFKDAQGRPHGSLTSLQRELEALRVRHREKMLEKDREIERVRAEAASEAAQTQNERRALARAEALQRELREKQAELDRARREREADKNREKQAYSAKLQTAVEKHQRQTDGLRQQLVAMETSLASARAELATERNLVVESRRRADAKLAEVAAAHKRELDRLVAEHAKTFAESRVAELQARLDSQEAVIEHLKAQTAASSSAAEPAEQLRQRERELAAEVAELRAVLADERGAHTPQMRQFVALRDRIKQLEARHVERERGVEQLLRETRAAARSDAQAEVTRWRQLAETRARQIDQFRAELDLILEVLRELQRRGVSLPVPPGLKDTLSGLSG
ncbi:hypothetical protein BOX15_Mlig010221g1 [Macrostomum lignano]|uniref:Centrosomal protein of 162 kDa n=1 Tax=Macrostomum lignano TaxID=282301 RepID=A0A267GM65_9PLAT|nr:hypothetical protein BOX15_Mlig010221g1 [Macrostomum lignano]